jgi:hypothetical protein
MSRWIWSIVLPLAGAGSLLLGLSELNRALRNQLQDDPRYGLPFAAIECQPPENSPRDAFLQEVRQRSSLSDPLPLLDESLPTKLAEAFARHPWVEDVKEVSVLPTHRITVRLTYRVPVLAVQHAGKVRAVDGHGILLPEAPTEGLPLWRGPSGSPDGPPGTRWGDAAIDEAARTLALLRPVQDQLHLTAVTASGGEVVLTTPAGSHVLWGHAPDQEVAGEAGAAVKCERLRQHSQKQGDLDHPDGPCEHDVRPADRALVRSLRRGN